MWSFSSLLVVVEVVGWIFVVVLWVCVVGLAVLHPHVCLLIFSFSTTFGQ
jgi:hypothetical protein